MGNEREREVGMIIQATLQEVDSGKVWDVSELIATSLKWSTELDGSFPGRLEFTLLEDAQMKISNGDLFTLKVSDQNIFKGIIRKRNYQAKNGLSLCAYDSKYLLKSKDTFVFPVETASSRFQKVCQLGKIKHNVVNASSHNCGEFVADSKSFHEIIQNALDETCTATRERYTIIDNFGTLEFVHLNHLITNIILGDESLVTDYTFEGSIEDVFNSIKVSREDSETKQRQSALAKDDKSIERWGLLQDVVSPSDSDMNEAQMQNQADNLLKESNREKRTLSLECIGQLGIRAGNTVQLQIEKLKQEGLYNKPFLVTKCTHTFSKSHTMSLEVEVV